MSMKARYATELPEKQEVTIEITMQVREWLDVRDGLKDGSYVAREFRAMLTEVITALNTARNSRWISKPYQTEKDGSEP